MKEAQDILGYRFKDPNLLTCALTHRSAINNNSSLEGVPHHNERMEFLGDALLGLLVSQLLYQHYPLASEGDLTTLKGHLVSQKALANIAKGIRLGDFLRLGKGEELSKGRGKRSILAGALEALIAALYLDGGWRPLQKFLLPHLKRELQDLSPSLLLDAKSKLQALVLAHLQVLPRYRVTSRKGLPHEPIFSVEVVAGRSILGKGKGRNKREAEQQAARAGLLKLEVDKGKGR